MTGYTYADRDEKPYVAPVAVEIEKGRSEVSQLEERFPELAGKLKAVARRLAAVGPITSTDVWEWLEINDKVTFEQAKKIARGKIMAAAFKGPGWELTDRYLPKGSHGRRVAEWRLKEAA